MRRLFLGGWLVVLAAACGDDSDAGACPAPADPVGTDLASQLPASVTGTTVDESNDLSGASCGDGGGAADALFTWTAPYAGTFRFSTEGSAFDTILFVRDGHADGPELGCNDEVRRGALQSLLALDLDACQTVVVAVDGFGGNAGEFTLTIEGTENSCGDGLDDDGDGQTDCDDPDCFGPSCPGTDDWPSDWAALEWAMLEEVNRYRAMGAECGGEPFAPAPPLEMDATIRRAARLHSQDMGAQNYFEHDSLDGRTFDVRMANEGFMGPSPWGENIAAGYATAAEATEGLMNSPGHCRNIMNPQFRVVGIGYAYDAGSDFGHYWTQDFAAGH